MVALGLRSVDVRAEGWDGMGLILVEDTVETLTFVGRSGLG